MQQPSTMAPTTLTQNAGATLKSSNQVPRAAMTPWNQKARDVAPINGAGPNNAENDDHEHGGHHHCPQKHTTQRRAPAEEPSSTGYLRTLGVQSGDSAQSPADTFIYNAGRNRNAKGPLISTNGRVKQPRYLDLNIDSYSYSRDAIGHSPDRSDNYIYTVKPDSPDDRRRSIASSTLNRVPEEMESGASTPEHRQQRQRSNPIRRGKSPQDAQPYYGSVGHGATSSRGYVDVDLLNEESDSSEVELEWLVDEELARQGLYRGMCRNNFSRGRIILTLSYRKLQNPPAIVYFRTFHRYSSVFIPRSTPIFCISKHFAFAIPIPTISTLSAARSLHRNGTVVLILPSSRLSIRDLSIRDLSNLLPNYTIPLVHPHFDLRRLRIFAERLRVIFSSTCRANLAHSILFYRTHGLVVANSLRRPQAPFPDMAR